MTDHEHAGQPSPLDVRERAAAGEVEDAVGAPQQDHGPHGDHGDGHHEHGDHAAMFRDRFWLSLLLAVPVVIWSEMFQALLGYTAPQFPGSQLIPRVLGT